MCGNKNDDERRMKPIDHKSVKELCHELAIEQGVNMSNEQLLLALEKAVDNLLRNDFERLIRIMYRVDIDEDKFNNALNSENSSLKIAHLMIERQLEKNYLRKKYQN